MDSSVDSHACCLCGAAQPAVGSMRACSAPACCCRRDLWFGEEAGVDKQRSDWNMALLMACPSGFLQVL